MQGIKIHTLNKITHPMRRGNKKGAKVEKIRLRAKEDKIEKETTPTTASRNSGNFTKKKKYPKILTKKCNHCHNNKRNSLPEPEPKLALHTETEDGVRFLSESMVSFRQYCLIEGQWIPLISQTQRKRLINDKQTTSSPEMIEYEKDENLPTMSSEFKIDQLQKIFEELQFNYLPYDEAFSDLSEKNRTHYLDLLNALTQKLHLEDRKCTTPALSPRNMASNPEKESESAQWTEARIPIENDLIQIIESLIKRRENSQLTISFQDQEDSESVRGFDSILIFLSKLFQVLRKEQNLEVIIRNLRTAEGHPKLQKLNMLLKEQPHVRFKNIIPTEILAELGFDLNESPFGIFGKCVFDFLNSQLVKLRPYYETSGQTFPWNFKMSAPITFYEITEDSLELAMLEGRNKILSKASQLCGLMVPEIEQNTLQWDFLMNYRYKRQLFSLKQEIDSKALIEKEDLEIENISTRILINLSQQLLAQLCTEFSSLISF